jgi:predicted CXXCH cytochrome family protein
MKVWAAVACVAVVPALLVGCDATARYRVLSVLFDEVPPPQLPEAPEAKEAVPAPAGQSRQVGYRAHGPYAARLCNACHVSGASNALVVPREQLCFQCHEIRLDKKYIHGPLASGGCTACHDPHSSQYRYLLISESDSFCFYCHDPQLVAKTNAHAGVEAQCTTCHDAHMSDKKYLLK